jgi:hypothetical protein
MEGVFRSSLDEGSWQLCEEVAGSNSGLLEIVTVSEDRELRGRIKVEFEDLRSHRLLLGARASSVAREFVAKNNAAAGRQHPFYRLGTACTGYVHVSFLWADVAFRGAVLSWLPLALDAFDHAITNDRASGLQMVAVLHPAIEMAHALRQLPTFSKAGIIEVRRRSDLRWDSDVLWAATRAKHVVCLTDAIGSGETIERVLDALGHLGVAPCGVICLIWVHRKGQEWAPPLPVFSFTEFDEDDLQHGRPE